MTLSQTNNPKEYVKGNIPDENVDLYLGVNTLNRALKVVNLWVDVKMDSYFCFNIYSEAIHHLNVK